MSQPRVADQRLGAAAILEQMLAVGCRATTILLIMAALVADVTGESPKPRARLPYRRERAPVRLVSGKQSPAGGAAASKGA